MWEDVRSHQPAAQAALHLHLLGEENLDELKGILDAVRERRAEVVADWYRAYAL